MSVLDQIGTAKINWSKYPSINSFSTNKEKAYLVLYIIKNELEQDNLTASEISKIIFKKFRKRISHQAIRGPLNRKIGEEVDIIHRSDGTIAYILLPEGVKKIGVDSIVINENFSSDQIIIPFDVVDACKGYIKKTVFQINGCYRDGYFDACAVMIRRLFETLIIEIYEKNNIQDRIKNIDEEYVPLSKLIAKISNEKDVNLSPRTKKHLNKVKLFGDTGAHSRKINLKKVDIDSQKDLIRLSTEELVFESC